MQNMQIIIPMSGFGERFRKAGYTVPKPLIELEGKPIIAHVIDLFPGETNFLFICNEDHLKEPSFHMEEILKTYCPSGKIIGIPAHKLGPVFAVQQVADLINSADPVIVNYCDFTCYWDFAHFKKFVTKSQCDGAIPAYKGFHPHSLGKTNYAYIREKKDQPGWIEDIQEKQPFTENRMEEFASSGTYYFASGKLMKEAFEAMRDESLTIGGEYYVSLAYKPLLKKGLNIAVYPIPHFMQWGTPEDVAEYQNWSQTFRDLMAPCSQDSPSPIGSVVIPMAGLGQRFAKEGYSLTKPLIPVSGEPMVVQATNDLPKAHQYAFVVRSDMPSKEEIISTLKKSYSNVVIKEVPAVTEGQACSALLGLETLEKEFEGASLDPITFAACDNGMLYNLNRWKKLTENPSIDVIVWGVRGHTNAIRHPHMFGWIDADSQGNISRISVKTPLSSPATDPIVLGAFTFQKSQNAKRVIQALIARNGRINGEFYLDSCINDAIEMGLKCQLFEVDHFISWGTPNDLRTFEYWQSCFHQWPSHPYTIEKDPRVPQSETENLKKTFRKPA
jgi:NDP-sugar pyrophosphorylase family protein